MMRQALVKKKRKKTNKQKHKHSFRLSKLLIIPISIGAIGLMIGVYHPLVIAENGNNDSKVELSFKANPTLEQKNLSETQEVLEDIDTEFSQKSEEAVAFYTGLKTTVEKKREQIAQFQRKVASLNAFLKKQGSPIAYTKHAEQIIRLSDAENVDYKIVVAIMGVESGFCAANYRTYNCFGYINRVTYPNYETAFNNLVPKIAKQYVKVYGTNFSALAKAYGMVNFQAGTAKLTKYYTQQS